MRFCGEGEGKAVCGGEQGPADQPESENCQFVNLWIKENLRVKCLCVISDDSPQKIMVCSLKTSTNALEASSSGQPI